MSSVSVVTNALRLRSFRRPATVARDPAPAAADPRHPVGLPRRHRGRRRHPRRRVHRRRAAPTRPSHGMNGQLAWLQGTGMTMRPSMSVMMTTDVPPVDADRGRRRPSTTACRPHARPGEPTRVVVTLRGRRHRDAGHRPDPHPRGVDAPHRHPRRPRHVRARPPGADRPTRRARRHADVPDRRHATTSTPSSPARASMSNILDRHTITVAGPRPTTSAPLVAGPRERVVDGVRVTLSGQAARRRHLRPDVLLRRRRDRASRSTT